MEKRTLTYLSEEKTYIMRLAGRTLRVLHTSVASNPDDYLRVFYTKTASSAQQAKGVLNRSGINPEQALQVVTSLVDCDEIKIRGVTRVHRDFRLPNLIYDPDISRVVAIDFEFAGIGLPYEDFANTYYHWLGQEKESHNCYGFSPESRTLAGFLLARHLFILSKASSEVVVYEAKQGRNPFSGHAEAVKRIINGQLSV